MKNIIKLNDEISVDIPKLIEGGMVILANSGGGKSYLIRRIAEQAVSKVQTIILDPEGEFSSLREKYDFILAGKDADVPADPRSAALLATKLLEINKSAVIDLYELHPQERQRFVKLFCDALVNAPKNLYHPVLIILDEAHEYVPEGKPSEATWAVESLASKGRKRGQRLILASQRISKLSKNAAAECNNKLIGRASQDIDMKRAGDELGFSKENLKDLRQLKPGEFFAFGPAISDEVIKVKIGEVETAHAKVGYDGVSKVPPPTEVIRKVLSELKDLPQEAEKEAKTMAEMRQQLTTAHREITVLKKGQKIPVLQGFDQKFVENAVKVSLSNRDEAWIKAIRERDNIQYEYTQEIEAIIKRSMVDLKSFKFKVSHESINEIPRKHTFKSVTENQKQLGIRASEEFNKNIISVPDDLNKTLGKCAKSILQYLKSVYPETRTKTQIWVATVYSPGGGFDNNIYALVSRGLIYKTTDGKYSAMEADDTIIQISLENWFSKLPLCARKIFQLLLQESSLSMTKQEIALQTGYALGGGFDNNIYELTGKELIVKQNGGYIINPEILNL